MYIHKLTLSNFKNYEEAEFLFSDKINCFVGNNGVGKTNLLDAIHYLAFCKSYFTATDMHNIRHGEEYFAIHGSCFRGGSVPDLLQCVQKKGQRKKFLLNKKEYERLADHIGMVPLVMISPYDRDLINDGSEIRRKYIDSVISQYDPLYLDDLINYNKALFQRNALLKLFAESQRFDAGSLEIWDEQMIPLGEAIFTKRQAFLEEFVPIFRKYYRFISGDTEAVDIRYVSQLSERTARELMSESLKRDRSTQFTNTGIHKDDLEYLMGGYPVKRYGSQGQQKSFVVAIKLAQFDFTKGRKGFKPILLLDDVFDKLDDLRVEQLIKLVSENSFGQVFITDTQEEKVRRIFDAIPIGHKIFRIPVNAAPLISYFYASDQPVKQKGGHTLKEAIGEFMKSYHLDDKLLQKQLILSWEKVMGKMVAKHTQNLTIRKKTLYVKLDSAALKNELSFSREKIMKALNNAVNAEVITDVVIQ